MKAQKIFTAILLFAIPFFGHAQVAERALTSEQQLEIRKGELANFEYVLLRFETAQEEHDLKSMESIRKELVKMMQKEIVSSPSKITSAADQNDPVTWLHTATSGDLSTEPQAIREAFKSYQSWMEKELHQP